MRARIIAALQELNKEWSFSTCNQLTFEDCDDLGVNVNCQRRPGSDSTGSVAAAPTRLRRQVGNEDQAYQLEISFPTVDNDEVVNENGQRVLVFHIM